MAEIVTAIKGRNNCAAYSRAAGEDMAGTVKPTDVWLLLEYRGRWEHHAAAVFSESVQMRLSALKAKLPKLRVALIKKARHTSGPLSVFWAFSRQENAQLYRSEITDYDALFFHPESPGEPTDEKIVAVCTHGTHDLCCAQFGNEIYDALREVDDASVWQISHVGGCRFAPNVVCLPHGIVYGRVERTDCADIVTSYRRGEVIPEKLRGRSCYSKPVQAAERFLRISKHLSRLDELNMTSAEETGPGAWTVQFKSGDSTRYNLSVRTCSRNVRTYKSCAATEASPREKFQIAQCL
jgi:hypothetical protein